MEQTERQLFSLLSEITPLYDAPMREAKARQDALAKPPGSLGLLEDLSVQLAGITGQVKNEVSHTRIYVLAADNGVVCEGVSSAPQSVTRAQAINLTRGPAWGLPHRQNGTAFKFSAWAKWASATRPRPPPSCAP